MKTKFLLIVIVCLSLFIPYNLKAEMLTAPKVKTELPVLPPALEKKAEQFKKKHPEMFSKKQDQSTENAGEESKQKAAGLIGFAISLSLLAIIIILLIVFL
ncbi:MAG: hypothetical protein M3R17_05945 [Bacteroidota bacterium]|nr:hypothetical protein [Bacteroidota bacterium]